ncbi:hypothetical protein FACS1894167_06330 [Synergistales bacterium]|nr:hypothetical protein FACS1894167_06330 [Synergistales bacterium]
MDYISAVGVTVGLLAGAWVYGSGVFGICGFAGFLGWASYFAAGGGAEGIKKAVCGNLSGVFWGFLTVYLSGLAPSSLGLAITILAAAIMCWQAKIPLLAFIPGTFIGNACFYANGNNPLDTAIGLACGIALGFISDYSAKKLSRNQSGAD